MRIPGFTAEESLYKTSEDYQNQSIMRDATLATLVRTGVVPAAIKVCRCPCCIQVGGNLVCCE